ncbi:hypothetical protein [Pontibacter ruber]|uniref:Uncharacterized protein n=1 Tax=Pontibacter ruber TaxID=1343895 RepID=A0ABW5D1S2_9BACT|nr:hypothetical protein [Pontibacter ruber]
MTKVLLLFLPLVALLFYFLRDGNTGSANPPGKLTKLAALPEQVKESSGVEVLPKNGHFITHNDAGNKPYLYELDEKGKLIETYKLQLPNVDWEALARDDEENFYIGDTGNNDNSRRELAVYKVSLADIDNPEAIRYTYEDQKAYPPAKKEMNFDCEAIFWYGGNVYLISKDRGRKQTAKVYQLSDEPGKHQAKLVGSVKLNKPVTDAAVSPDGKSVVLLSEGGMHLFAGLSDPTTFFKNKYKSIPLKEAGQTEGVAFEDNSTLVITSEGGNLYRYKL